MRLNFSSGVTTVSDPSAPLSVTLFGNYSSPPVVESAQPQAVASGVAGAVPGPGCRSRWYCCGRRSCRFTAAGSRSGPCHRRRPGRPENSQTARTTPPKPSQDRKRSQPNRRLCNSNPPLADASTRANPPSSKAKTWTSPLFCECASLTSCEVGKNLRQSKSALCRGRIGLPFRIAPLKSPHKGEQLV